MLRSLASFVVVGLIAVGICSSPQLARGQSRYQLPVNNGSQPNRYGGAGNSLESNYQRQPAQYAPPYGQPPYGQAARPNPPYVPPARSNPPYVQGSRPGSSTGSTRGANPPQNGQRRPVYTAQAPAGSTRTGSGPIGPSGPSGPAANSPRPTAPPNQALHNQALHNQAPHNHGPQTHGPHAHGPQSQAGNVNNPGARQPVAIRAPFGQLDPQQQKFIDKLLDYWEFSTKDIQRYQCTFQLWRYDPVFGPRDPNVPVEYSQGVIKYESPDRGLYKVEKSKLYRRPEESGENAEWIPSKAPGDHWVCDGKALFEFDWNRKLMIKRPLPPHVQGVQIANGPLPFLLKAKAAQVRARFWVRGIPSPRPNEYRIEAYPKRRSDAANFQKLHIVLNESYLPKALVVFNPGFRPNRPARTTYEFDNIDPKPTLPWFGRQFIVTAAPGLDWRSIEEAIPTGAVPPGPPQQSRRP